MHIDALTSLSIPSTLLGMVREMISKPNYNPERSRRVEKKRLPKEAIFYFIN